VHMAEQNHSLYRPRNKGKTEDGHGSHSPIQGHVPDDLKTFQ
jgi:hypothetical protein